MRTWPSTRSVSLANARELSLACALAIPFSNRLAMSGLAWAR